MITHWVQHNLVLSIDDREKWNGRHADTIDQGDECTALVVQECASPFAAHEYLKRIETVFSAA